MMSASEPKPGLSALSPQSLTFRELISPVDVVALLRLRHRVYFEQRAYGKPKPLGLDLSAHDVCARLFGVFCAGELVGGVRCVFRHERGIASIARTVQAIAQTSGPDPLPTCLPSEEAFDFAGVLGARASLIDAEVGRLIMARSNLGPDVTLRVMVATLAVLLTERVRFYMYSCGERMAERYARVSNPRWRLTEPRQTGIGADAFVFPIKTVAAVATAEDSPYLEAASMAARLLERDGEVGLSSTADAWFPSALGAP